VLIVFSLRRESLKLILATDPLLRWFCHNPPRTFTGTIAQPINALSGVPYLRRGRCQRCRVSPRPPQWKPLCVHHIVHHPKVVIHNCPYHNASPAMRATHTTAHRGLAPPLKTSSSSHVAHRRGGRSNRRTPPTLLR
jgi:hypothetical protein